jgi:transcriptional regulator with XRE-family HTH domain
MEERYILGNRLRSFRKRTGMSQLQLETAIGMAQGALSRIENGEVNPTKETLQKIADVLKLHDRERRYLYGDLFYPADEKEIQQALNEVDPYLNTKGVLAYVIDERFRFIAGSKSFQKALGISDEVLSEIHCKPFHDVILGERFNFKQYIDPEYLDEVIKHAAYRLYSETYFMMDDESVQESIKAMESNPLSNKYWKEALKDEPIKYHSTESRKVYLKMMGIPLEFVYSDSVIINYSRFYVVDYLPMNNLYKKVFKHLL